MKNKDRVKYSLLDRINGTVEYLSYRIGCLILDSPSLRTEKLDTGMNLEYFIKREHEVRIRIFTS